MQNSDVDPNAACQRETKQAPGLGYFSPPLTEIAKYRHEGNAGIDSHALMLFFRIESK